MTVLAFGIGKSFWLARGRLSGLAAAVCGLLALYGCAADPVPKDTFYRISAPTGLPAMARPVLDGPLVVESVIADGIFRERAVVYSDGNGVLRQYSYHFWATAPGRMLQHAAHEHLKARGLAAEVLPPTARPDRAHVLRGRVLTLEHVLDGADTRISVAIEWSYYAPGTAAPVFLETYRETEPAPSRSVAAAAGSLADALARIHERLIEDIAGAVRGST